MEEHRSKAEEAIDAAQKMSTVDRGIGKMTEAAAHATLAVFYQQEVLNS